MKSRYKSIRITEIWLWIISSTDPTLRLNPFFKLEITYRVLSREKEEGKGGVSKKKKMPQENKKLEVTYPSGQQQSNIK